MESYFRPTARAPVDLFLMTRHATSLDKDRNNKLEDRRTWVPKRQNSHPRMQLKPNPKSLHWTAS